MLRISWTRHVSNEEILKIAKTQRTIWTDIREGRRKFIGHVNAERRIGTNRNDRKDSRQEKEGKKEANEVTIHGR